MSGSRGGVVYGGPACPRCGRALDPFALPSGPTRCPSCYGEFEATRFEPPAPALRITRTDTAGPNGATACPQHPRNAAVGHCERCGILTCALCQIQADHMLLCPACFERLSDEGALASTRVSFRDHGRLSVTLALLGMVMCFVGIATGPAAIYYGIRAYQQRQAMNEAGGAWRLVFVSVLGLAQFGLGVWMIWIMVTAK